MGDLNIKEYFLKKNRCYIQNKKRTPIGIQIHSIGCAQGTAKSVADYWNQSSVSAAVTYIVDADVAGKVLQTLPEDLYSWADGGYGNRNLITIEVCESDFMRYYSGGSSYEITNEDRFKADILRGYDTAVALCAEICTRYKWDPEAKLPSGLYLISSHDEGRRAGLSTAHVDPSHLWPRVWLNMDTFRKSVKVAMAAGAVAFTETDDKYFRVRKSWTDVDSQIGAYFTKDNAVLCCPPGYHVYDSNGKSVYTNKEEVTGTQAADFAGLSESAAAKKILEMVKNTDTSGILYSVTAAQAILESGYISTQLAKAGNNIFGMKKTLSGNTWDSVWDGVSVVNIYTSEYLGGKYIEIYDDFRKYKSLEDSVKDHAGYLLGAKNGKTLRYEGVLEARNYKEAITIIKNGGYATDPNYISKIVSIIERFGLDEFDKVPEVKKAEKKTYFRVQVGAYQIKENAEKRKATVEEKTKFKGVIYNYGGTYPYRVICGSFMIEENAKKRAEVLKKLGVTATVGKVKV